MGKKLAELNFTNRLYKSLPYIFLTQKSTPISNPKILHVNSLLMEHLELDSLIKEHPSFLRFLNGDLEFEGLFFGASFYSGHQFGHYVPRLGDGRALMLGEVCLENGEFRELQLKGSGLTPFSRMGDGRAVVRSSLREYLASAHLKALGIPTTEALAIIAGNDDVFREEIEKSAMVLRVAESFLRFGHYEYFAHTHQKDELKKLVDYTIANYFSAFFDHPNKYVLFYQEVVKKTAKLFAKWQAIGFCHGVLNTDNMSILGLTLDYGPFGFIDQFDLDHICNHSDHEGRYSLGNQPAIGKWNLMALANALETLISKEDLTRTLASYEGLFNFEYQSLLRQKCGLEKMQESDGEFLRSLLNMLVETQLDYTNFFRALSHYKIGAGKLLGLKESEALENWLKQYELRLKIEEIDDNERQVQMLRTNPKFILRNYLAHQATLNHNLIGPLFNILINPFDEWPEFHEWSKPSPQEYKSLIVSCSS